jgi:type I restriction enzyme S subunit
MKRYETYKPSGVEWLGEIPEHWQEKRVKDLTSKIGSGVTPTGGAEVYSDNGIPFFRSQNIYNNKLSVDDIVYISEEIDKSMSNSRIRPNDILLNITGASIGRCYYVPNNFKRGNVNQHVCIIRPIQNKITTNFLHFELISQYGQVLIEISQNGANREGLNFQQIKNFVFAIPPHTEQTNIANYLDTKTTAIDRKIELLTAKANKYKALRRSLINETVCRGLNPKVPQKDSGIEWIGKIPKHWEVKRFKEIASTVKGRNLDLLDTYFEKSLPNLSLEYLRNESINFDTFCFTQDKNQKVTSDDMIIIWDGAGVGEILKGKDGYLSSTIAKIVVKKKKYDSDFLFHLRFSIEYILKMIPAGMGIPHLNPQVLNSFSCPCPPLNEQKEIAQYLNEKSTQIDTILTNISEQINKLTQLRKTLINDVVTGKIKVTED